jgi:hypothetical protein
LPSAPRARLPRPKPAIEQLKYTIANLRHERFGQSSERSAILEQLELSLADLEEDASEAALAAQAAAANAKVEVKSFERRKPARRPLPENLPRERIVYPAPAACPCCGGGILRKIGEDVTETLELVPRQWKVVQHVREKFSCRACETITQPPAAAVFFYSRDRGGEHPEGHLAHYAGLMQADAYAGFNRLYEAGRKPGPIVEAACWAHARRKFFDLARLNKAPIAIEAVERIDALFAIEREINGVLPNERYAVRAERSRPLAIELEIWLREQRAKLSSKNETAKAIDYSLKRWAAFTRFLDDGRLCMSNNAAERAVRGIAVGRKNWTFAGSDNGARRAAAIYTLIETALCRARHKAVYAAC